VSDDRITRIRNHLAHPEGRGTDTWEYLAIVQRELSRPDLANSTREEWRTMASALWALVHRKMPMPLGLSTC